MTRHPAIPYVAPFAAFMLLLAVGGYLPLGKYEFLARILIVGGVLWAVSRPVIDLRPRQAAGSVLLGLVVFVVWIAPDLLWPAWRQHWLFQNALTGAVGASARPEWSGDLFFLATRSMQAVLLVPLIEELFWRGWLLRWLIRPDFLQVRLGAYTASSFWIASLLFATEHGPYWDVGLLAGVLYNIWIIRTRSLADCILAHAVTNAALCAYVIAAGKWEYWM